ncbi:transmembrane protease serine 6 isoform X3 [Neocloeon triangulifer]|nr:transmembrane protease serine 6 isoform X3 [Neocloeon triangulifer]XP_059472131.1 transmembrane protease serine 6 isoform X3 [Neocloeon triangulifer]
MSGQQTMCWTVAAVLAFCSVAASASWTFPSPEAANAAADAAIAAVAFPNRQVMMARGASAAFQPPPHFQPVRYNNSGLRLEPPRWRRYVRFPGNRGFHQRPQPWGATAPAAPPVIPAGPRSPRLVFRDPDYISNNNFPTGPGVPQQQPQFPLQDYSQDDSREASRVKQQQQQQQFNVGGDQSLCFAGKCEFFLLCWMSGGLIEGSCGGFMFACCQRKQKSDDSLAINDHGSNSIAQQPDLEDKDLDDYVNGPVTNDPRCGVSLGEGNLGAQRRIVGGDEAGFGSFPWQAYIRIGSSRCGGSLVNRYHVVTAGHCVARATSRQVQVTLGDYIINSQVEPLPAFTYGVREIKVHPYFKFTPQADRFDVAVLKLDRAVHYMPHIAPICLPEKNEDFLGQFGWAAGWGALQAGSRLRPKTLQAVDVPVIDNRLCERWHKANGINVVIYDEMMCAGYRGGGKDSCQGDSGGPLMMEKSNRWYLIGIVSAGYSCAQRGQPGIYHRVAQTVDWISHVINK